MVPITARDFQSPYRHGFLRVATAVPALRVADPAFNGERTVALYRRAAAAGAALVVFPELGLTGYSVDDLLQQDALLDGALAALAGVAAATRAVATVAVVGLPVRIEDALFNCAAVLHAGRVLGVVPKSYLPNYREFYEKRHFVAARQALRDHVVVFGESAPFGADLVFEARGLDGFRLHVEVCEDVWVPVPPSAWAALSGATVLVNLSASNATIGKAEYRHLLCASHSARTLAAYVYAAAGFGESTTDLAWDGHAMIWENGMLLAESERFGDADQCIVADVDLDLLRQERMRMSSFQDQVGDHAERLARLRRVPFDFTGPADATGLRRAVERFPYVPADPTTLDQRCAEVFAIQTQGLAKRLQATGIERVVIGVSGGLDSTLALLVAVAAMTRLGHPPDHVLAYTLPGFATSAATLAQAHALMAALDVEANEIDIRPACMQMLRDIEHPAARGEAVHDVAYENVQAGQRTSLLFRLANQRRALVIGTGDLSELALGWCTYGVGDQMSHYGVNASVPKTLIRHLLRWAIDTRRYPAAVSAALERVLHAVISPELIPPAPGSAEPTQHTEAAIGPFDLQDFHLYHLSRFGFRPSKIAFLALYAWGDRARGAWPALVPAAQRVAYTLPEIRHWLGVFLRRFVRDSQFKRSASPNAPKVGSGGSLSPRGDWRAPSDAEATAWLEELERNVPGA